MIIEFKDLLSAKSKGLVQLTNWLTPVSEELQYIENEYKRISKDETRTCLMVKHKHKIALFVNDVSEVPYTLFYQKMNINEH